MGLLACTSCRSRKVACDRKLPSCTRCLFSVKTCEYRARKPTKTAIYSKVKLFEARLGTVESNLLQEEPVVPGSNEEVCATDEEKVEKWNRFNVRTSFASGHMKSALWADVVLENPFTAHSREEGVFPEEQLQRKLFDRYFENVYPSAPIIHESRFFRALESNSTHAPPLALRFAMWAIAALGSTEHQHLAERFYILGRRYADDLEMKGGPNEMATSHAQCWFLLALYEATRAYFTRAFLSICKCVRLVQMMSLHLLDSPNEDGHILKQAGWTEKEEGRRVFWGAYLGDRWACSLSGHPLIIRDEDIYTNLPSSEESFRFEIEEIGMSLKQAGSADNITHLSQSAGSCFTTTLLGRCIKHIGAYEHNVLSENYSDYWNSHRELDNSISLVFMNLPTHLRVSSNEQNVEVVALQFNLHVAVILMHQMAIKVATKQKMHKSARRNSSQRCFTSAMEIKDIVYSVKDLRILANNMWLAFSIYKAAGVFIEDILKPDTSPTSAMDLGLLIIALKEIKAHQTYDSFFVQRLESDILRTGVAHHIPTELRGMAGIGASQGKMDAQGFSWGVNYCGTSNHSELNIT